VLTVESLDFAYRGRRQQRPVFEELEWSVAPGETTLLLGPNGAGKSTLLKLLSGFERPQSGTVALDGSTSRRDLYKRVGWMPQDVQPARGLSVKEQVEYAGWLSGLTLAQSRSRARQALAAVDLVDLHTRPSDELSGGQLRRLGLAQTLVREADVLLLDEPTAGLDPAQALVFRDIVRALAMPGGVVISTHQVEDLAGEVDRVAVLSEGRFVFDDTAPAFTALGSGGASLARVFADMIGGGGH
jgi:ABC-2 type transport system ATP-binding protein